MNAGVAKYYTAMLVIAVIAIASVASYGLISYTRSSATFPSTQPSGMLGTCILIKSEMRSNLTKVSFGQITEYKISGPDRWLNAVYVDKDGSLWIGEQALPGVAHFFPKNNTLIEYPVQPERNASTAQSCGLQTSIWGIQKINNTVWFTDMDNNELLGFNTLTKTFTRIHLPAGYESPYTLYSSPNNELWFTLISSKPAIGEILSNGTLLIHQVILKSPAIPSSIYFVNRTLAYFAAFNLSTLQGYVYSFNPSTAGNQIIPDRVSNYSFIAPNSIVYKNKTIWITQHSPSNIALLNLSSKSVTIFPTSLNNLTNTALPYFAVEHDGLIVFNEHYANKIAVLNTSNLGLTEYSESNPPVRNITSIDNVLTIADSRNGVWFVSMTSNYIGFLNLTEKPSFYLSTNETRYLTMSPGSQRTLHLSVKGIWDKLLVNSSDSEQFTSVPEKIKIIPSTTEISPGSGEFKINFTLSIDQSIKQGSYTIALTVYNGLVYQSLYFIIKVT